MKFLRWSILGVTLLFLAKAFRDHWQEVAQIAIAPQQFAFLAIAFLVTTGAHVWSAWVWHGLLQTLGQKSSPQWVLPVYLKTNIAKYLPGNVWHFYGRIEAVKAAGSPLGMALLSVLLEPLLMAAAAVAIALVFGSAGGPLAVYPLYRYGSWLGLAAVLAGVHPRLLNPVVKILSRRKAQRTGASVPSLKQYPWQPLLGEVTFVLLRGAGFVVAIAAFVPVSARELPQLLGAFSSAWFLGLVIPTPGGIGIFETTAIALLGDTYPTALVLGALALFRLVSLLAEAVAAGFAWLLAPKITDERST